MQYALLKLVIEELQVGQYHLTRHHVSPDVLFAYALRSTFATMRLGVLNSTSSLICVGVNLVADILVILKLQVIDNPPHCLVHPHRM